MLSRRAVVKDPKGIWLRVNGPPQLLALGCLFAVKSFPQIKHQDPLQGAVSATSPMPFEPLQYVPKWLRRILATLVAGRSHSSLFPVSLEGQEG